jgi:hypothetical protein
LRGTSTALIFLQREGMPCVVREGMDLIVIPPYLLVMVEGQLGLRN